MNKVVIKIIGIGISIFLVFIFISIYESIFYQYYDENKAQILYNKIFIPILFLFYIVLIFSSRKKLFSNFSRYYKEVISMIGIFGIVWIIFSPFGSGLLLIINQHFGTQENIVISGIVEEVYMQNGGSKSIPEYELTVLDDSLGKIVLDMRKPELIKFAKGTRTTFNVRKGSLGLIYRIKE